MIIKDKAQETPWEDSKKIFYEKFFPNIVWRQEEKEFRKLKQKYKIVVEYEEEFADSAKITL